MRETAKEMYGSLCLRFHIDFNEIQKASARIFDICFTFLNPLGRNAHCAMITDYVTNLYMHESGAKDIAIPLHCFNRPQTGKTGKRTNRKR
jgi:hypothetical protein